MTLICLACERVFPETFRGERGPGGAMLCLGCGHVMIWREDMTLREMTDDERTDLSSNFELMRERAKIIPRRGVQHRGSWAVTFMIVLILVMIVLERLHVIAPIHPH